LLAIMNSVTANPPDQAAGLERRIADLIARMTLDEKIGQMSQVDASQTRASEHLGEALRGGLIGSVINQVDPDTVNELQRIAVEDSRLGIPLLVGRDVIHGFATIMPIPLGQAATWNPGQVRAGARVAAVEAAAAGVNWTFAPMIDIARDPRWGRIAESLGEDPLLTSILGIAMIEGFQGNDLAAAENIAACAKHFAGYGAAESGRDYATTNIPENELRNIYLRPFSAAADAGVASMMTSFIDLDGIPASANAFLLRGILRDEWGFDGFVVSDWDSIRQLSVHGLTGGDRDSAYEAASAGVEMEMACDVYRNYLAGLVAEGRVGLDTIDDAVANILRIKIRLGLFENPYRQPGPSPSIDRATRLGVAKQSALESVVLLKNDGPILPLSRDRIHSLAVIGPLADAPYEQLGTWIFDGDADLSVTGLDGIRDLVGSDIEIRYVRAMETSRSRQTDPFCQAVEAALVSDVAILFLGEESILSGEAHSRADIGLPGAQATLVRQIRQTGKPVVAVILAGRPLVLSDIVDEVDAILFAWHPGTMGGAAIADLLFGIESPSGKLPVTFPRMVGQVPIYYNRKNTGKPPSPDTVVHIDDIDAHAPQTSFGMTAFHLDAGYTPLFAFGHGLSYAEFTYDNLTLSASDVPVGHSMTVSVDVKNESDVPADEVVQLYVRDLVGNVTRPIRELKGFRRVHIEPGMTVTVDFELHTDDLAFFGRDNTLITEPGEFHLWVGGSSEAELRTEFRVVGAG
jgi:beta-glucosidase